MGKLMSLQLIMLSLLKFMMAIDSILLNSKCVMAAAARANISDSAESMPPLSLPLTNYPNQFFATLGVGSPPQYFPMLLDSGSEELWIPGPHCHHCDSDDKTFSPKLSRTFSISPDADLRSAGYASGEVWFREANEVVTCAADENEALNSIHKHLELHQQEISNRKKAKLEGGSTSTNVSTIVTSQKAVASSDSSDDLNSAKNGTSVPVRIGLTDQESPVFRNMPFDGIIGLAPSKSNLIEALYKNGKLGKRQVGLNLQKHVNKLFMGGKANSEFKGTNKQIKGSDTLGGAPVVWVPNAAHDGYWSIADVEFLYYPKIGNSPDHDLMKTSFARSGLSSGGRSSMNFRGLGFNGVFDKAFKSINTIKNTMFNNSTITASSAIKTASASARSTTSRLSGLLAGASSALQASMLQTQSQSQSLSQAQGSLRLLNNKNDVNEPMYQALDPQELPHVNELKPLPGGPFRVIVDSGSSVTMMTTKTQNNVMKHVRCGTRLVARFRGKDEANSETNVFNRTFAQEVDVYAATRGHSSPLDLKLALTTEAIAKAATEKHHHNLDSQFESDSEDSDVYDYGAPPPCLLDVMDLNGFDDNVIIFGKDWFERVETWFNWDRNEIGFLEE